MIKQNILPLVLCLIVAFLYYSLVTQLEESFDKMVQANKSLELVVAQQHKDIKKCLNKLPEKDVKAFFEENRKEFYQRFKP